MLADQGDVLHGLPPTHQRAIEATISLIAEQGAKGPSLREIGQAAGVNFGNLASYFGGRDRIIAECFRQVAATSLAREKAFFDQAISLSLPAEYGVSILWDLCEASGTRYRTEALVMMELILSAEGNPLFEDILRGWFAERTATIRKWGGSIGLAPVACDALNLLILAESCFYLSCGKSLLYRLVAEASLAEVFAACSAVNPAGSAASLPDIAQRFYSPTAEPSTDPGKEGAPTGTRAQIIEAAADVVTERGLDGLTMRLVAQQAGISLGLITYHFPSVTKLALIGLNRLCERAIVALDDPTTRHPVLERLLDERRRPFTIPTGSLLAYRGFLQLALTAGRMPEQAVLGQMLRSKMGHVIARAMDVSFEEPGSRTLAGSFALMMASLFTIVPALRSTDLPIDLPEVLHFLTYDVLGFASTSERNN